MVTALCNAPRLQRELSVCVRVWDAPPASTTSRCTSCCVFDHEWEVCAFVLVFVCRCMCSSSFSSSSSSSSKSSCQLPLLPFKITGGRGRAALQNVLSPGRASRLPVRAARAERNQPRGIFPFRRRPQVKTTAQPWKKLG